MEMDMEMEEGEDDHALEKEAVEKVRGGMRQIFREDDMLGMESMVRVHAFFEEFLGNEKALEYVKSGRITFGELCQFLPHESHGPGGSS